MPVLDIKVVYSIAPNSPYDDINISFICSTGDAPSFNSFQGALLDTVTDAPNNKFASPEDAIAYYYSAKSAYLLGQLNTYFSSANIARIYTLGNMIVMDKVIQDQVNTKQASHANLDAIAGIAGGISSDMLALLAADNSTDLRSAMALGISDVSGVQTALDAKVDKVMGKGLSTEDYSTAEKSKLAGLASGATANSPDATLLARANHTGTQLATTISDFTTTAQALGGKSYQGTTQRNAAFPIFKSATVASGVAVFHLTNDGLSTGTALFPTSPIAESVNAFVSDAIASYQMSYAFTNSNKTLTVTTNKLTTSNILTGILGQAQANGSVVNLQVWGY